MTLLDLRAPSAETPWLRPESYWPALTEATRHLDTPVAALHLGALRHNTHDVLRRAGGTPIRVASKSIRVRGVLEAVLALPGYRGVLAFTLAEALWLAESIEDIAVGYPTADRAAIDVLGRSPLLASRVTLMVDSLAQLDLIDSVIPPHRRESIRVCIELDAGWSHPVLGHLGVLRSPVHTVDDVRDLARGVVARPGFALVGLMAYESQVAGLGDRPSGRGPGALTTEVVNRWVRRHSIAELGVRRAAAVAAVREVAALEFVNGGGTGSLESTHADPSVTDIAVGSAFFGGHLFDNYSAFRPAPAAAFALSVVRKPSPATATLLGGGWIASGPPGADRMPSLAWPVDLAFVRREAAGEVQTPLTGPGAAGLGVGDRVWLRHTKSGKLSEHVAEFAVVHEGRVVDLLPTYRGEGKAFL